MKARIALLAAGWLLWAGTLRGQEADGMTQILRLVEANNKELQAAAQQAKAAQWENRAGNNLPDPTLSYAHVWDSSDSEITQGELIVSQSFDFPTLYASRHRMNRYANAAIDADLQATRQRILLEAKQLCIELTALHQQRQLLRQRMEQADRLAQLYQLRLNEGDANQLEMNKIKLEQLNAQTAYRLTESTLQSKMQQLIALNGQQPLTAGKPGPLGPAAPQPEAIGLTTFADTPLPTDFLTLFGELVAADPQLQALEQSRLAAARQLSVSRQGWLPKLELGYRRNSESGHPLNGVVVGFSIPLFENRGKVKSARLQSMSVSFQREDALGKEQSRLNSLYEEASQLHQQILTYRATLSGPQHLALLEKALKEGEISLIDFFVEATLVYESEGNLIELQSRYEAVLAELYRCRL